MEEVEFLCEGERWVECVEDGVLNVRETRLDEGFEMGEDGAGRVGIKFDTDECLLFRREEVVDDGVIVDD